MIDTLPSAPVRPVDAHKGTFGRVLVIGGSRGMSGAPSLAGLGALRGGAGLVYVAVPSEILPIVAAIEPSYLTIPLATDEEHGCLSTDGLTGLRTACEGKDAVALGPGLGQSRGVAAIVNSLFTELPQPMVVDADALNALAASGGAGRLASSAAGPRILTPHPGEFARLIGSDIATVQSQRAKLAAEFAATHGVIVLLKGQGTIITDGDRVAINRTGNPGMATGGSGDVLTGLIAALLAQGMPAFQAAQVGAHLHGLAGDLAAAELSQPGLIASDLPKFLTQAWQRFLG
ncbi:MAG: NAD(P)H-hydrate dehydratase [Planctomycetota bacterium]|nr:MAG: NAD(P)H-hydrate dehydratase [Planctomycetota bacterium]